MQSFKRGALLGCVEMLLTGTTAVLDKLSGAVLLETRNRDARMQFLTAIVEQLLVDNKRARDTEAAVMNMQLGRLRDGRAAGASLVSGAADDLRARCLGEGSRSLRAGASPPPLGPVPLGHGSAWSGSARCRETGVRLRALP